MNDNITVSEAVMEHRVIQQVGSIRAGEEGGLEVQKAGIREEWIWTDSPATVKR